MKIRATALSLLCTLALALAAPAARADGELTLPASGSSSMASLLERWSEGLSAYGLEVDFDAAGSAAGASALLSGRAGVAALSRPLSETERRAFEETRGLAPIAIPVALDAVVWLVNGANPLPSIHLGQIAALYGADGACASGPRLSTWGDLGLTGEWADRRVGLHGRGTGSGTREFVQGRALCDSAFRDDVRESPGARSVALAIAESRFALGYGGRTGLPEGVRVLPLAASAESGAIEANEESLRSGAYPFTRTLLLVVPGTGVSDEAALLLEHAVSPEGQAQVRSTGAVPLGDSLAREARSAVAELLGND